MEFSKTQQKIIQDIVDKKVKDLNTFYSTFFTDLNKLRIAADITGYIKDLSKPDFPSNYSIANTQGIILDDAQVEIIIDFIEVWKKLGKVGLIYSNETNVSPYLNKYTYLIPLYPSEKIEKFNNELYNYIKDFLNKTIIITEELKVFVENNFRTYEEKKFDYSHRWTKIIGIAIILSMLITAMFNFLTYNLQKQRNNDPETDRVIIQNQIQKDTVNTDTDKVKKLK